MQLADAIWTATALLHQENPLSRDFEVQEIVSRAVEENFVGGFRPGLQPHASWHCVANKKPAGGRYRMLYETSRGRRRLSRPGDSFHPDRNGKIKPEESDLPERVRSLVGWYDRVYSKKNDGPAMVSVRDRNSAKPAQVNLPLTPFGSSQLTSGPVFLSATGSVVIPEALRIELGLTEGSCLSIYREKDFLILQPITEDFIRSVRGSCKGEDSLVEAREREHRLEK